MDLKSYLKTHQKTHLIFDLDETILELILPWELWEKAIEDQLRKVDPQILKDYQNHQLHLNVMQNLYVSKSAKMKDLFIKNSQKFETENLENIRVNHELIDLIKSFKGYHIFLWTSNSKITVQKALKKVGILQKFKKIICRDDVRFLKPEIDAFNLIFDPKVPKSKYLFIGNNIYDEQAAKSAGIDFYQEDYFK